MDLMEITEKERLSRKDAAARRTLATARQNNDVEFDSGGVHFKMHVPDEVDFKLEIELQIGERTMPSALMNAPMTPSDAPPADNRPSFVPSDSATRCAASPPSWSTSATRSPSYAGRSRS